MRGSKRNGGLLLVRQVTALPTPLNPSSREVYPCFSKSGRLSKEGSKSAFHGMCPSSSGADEHNCSSKDCGIDDGNVLLVIYRIHKYVSL